MEIILEQGMKKQLDEFVDNPSHALLLVGRSGTGKQTTLQHITSIILNIDMDHINQNPNVYIIKEDKAISIERIRDARNFVKLRPTSHGKTSRVIIINSAEQMTLEAQNALLKLLEEPPEGTVIMLSVTTTNMLLETVVSRCRVMNIAQPSKQTIIDAYTAEGLSLSDIERAYAMSGGRVGLISSNLSNTDDDSESENYQVAKTFLQSKKYERLLMAQSIVDLQDISQLLFALKRIIQISLRSKTSEANASKLVRSYKLIQECEDTISGVTPNSKLLMTRLALEL